MHAALIAISTKIAGRPPSRTKCDMEFTSPSVTEALTRLDRRAPRKIAGHRGRRGGRRRAASVPAVRVWIDLTNSPHVLVMRPVIEAAARGRPRGAT